MPAPKENIAEINQTINFIFNAKGFCQGLTTLALFALLTTNRNPYPEKELDDFNYFKKMRSLLLGWDGKKEFTKKEKQEIERFIGLIIYFQQPADIIFKEYATEKIDQSDISVTLQNEAQISPILEKTYQIQDILPKDVFPILTKIIKPEKLIFFAARIAQLQGHVIGIYQSSTNNIIYLYDSNSNDSEPYTFKPEEIQKIVKKLEEIFDTSSELKNVKIKVFSFPKKEAIPKINPQEISDQSATTTPTFESLAAAAALAETREITVAGN